MNFRSQQKIFAQKSCRYKVCTFLCASRSHLLIFFAYSLFVAPLSTLRTVLVIFEAQAQASLMNNNFLPFTRYSKNFMQYPVVGVFVEIYYKFIQCWAYFYVLFVCWLAFCCQKLRLRGAEREGMSKFFSQKMLVEQVSTYIYICIVCMCVCCMYTQIFL